MNQDKVLPWSVIRSVRTVVSTLDGTDVTAARLESGALTLEMARVPTMAAAATVVPGPGTPTPETGPNPVDALIVPITSERVGRFLMPTPVRRGDKVKAGDIVACIEAMALLNEVRAPVDGRIVEILVEPGHPVEYGQVLMALVPGPAPGES